MSGAALSHARPDLLPEPVKHAACVLLVALGLLGLAMPWWLSLPWVGLVLGGVLWGLHAVAPRRAQSVFDEERTSVPR